MRTASDRDITWSLMAAFLIQMAPPPYAHPCRRIAKSSDSGPTAWLLHHVGIRAGDATDMCAATAIAAGFCIWRLRRAIRGGGGVLRHVRIVAGSQFWRRSASCRSSHDPRSPCQCDHAVDLLSATAIVALLVLCGWLSLRLHGANRDIRELRTRVESLKRQILPLR